MIQGQFRNRKITTWLLPVVLVLSLFTFPGVSTPSSPKLQKTTTEQIDLVRVSNKKCAPFKFFAPESTLRFDSPAIGFQQIAICHTLYVRTEAKQCTRDCLEFIVINYSLLQNPQQNSEDDFSISTIG